MTMRKIFNTSRTAVTATTQRGLSVYLPPKAWSMLTAEECGAPDIVRLVAQKVLKLGPSVDLPPIDALFPLTVSDVLERAAAGVVTPPISAYLLPEVDSEEPTRTSRKK